VASLPGARFLRPRYSSSEGSVDQFDEAPASQPVPQRVAERPPAPGRCFYAEKDGKPSETKKSCFVIAPVGDPESDERKRTGKLIKHIIEPALRPLGFGEPVRADQLDEPGIITNQIVEHIETDDLVVADMTDFNANVFYEMAARHVVKKPIVHLIHSTQLPRIPFDVNQVRAIPYTFDIDDVEGARKQVAGQVEAWGKSDKAPDNPLSRGFEVAALRRSGDPVEQRLGELQAAVDQLSSEIRTVAAVVVQGFANFGIVRGGIASGGGAGALGSTLTSAGTSGVLLQPFNTLYAGGTSLSQPLASGFYSDLAHPQASQIGDVEPQKKRGLRQGSRIF
jgi:hypothetical protein